MGRGRLLKGFVLLDQVLHLVDGLTELVRLEVGILGDQPGLGNCSVSGELVDLQNKLQVLPSLLPSEKII